MAKKHGRLTLPAEQNFLAETKELMARWGADAIRDSDGTKLEDDIKQLDAKLYSTYFVVRNHNEFASQHLEERQQLYLMTTFNLATGNRLEIELMKGYFSEQVAPNYDFDVKKYWEVIDRTTGEVISTKSWTVDQKTNRVTLEGITPWHEYTVSFLAVALWDPTQMYNHITNDWGDVPHDIPLDIRQPASNQFAETYLKEWLQANPEIDVVRFTTFFYHFTLVFNQLGKEKFVDWFGYGTSVSVAALEAFEKEYGYALRPEDFVDQGYYNTTFRVPSQSYRDYLDFIQRFVAKEAGKLVKLVQDSGKEAMMFLGDNWIGTEPYGKYFKEINLDAVVGSVGGGATLRLISEIPHVKYTEGRFLPYFFPDTFFEGNDPVIEANENWLAARRAIMRKPVDRIGYGGYPSLAYQFPEFVDYVAHVADEFREIYHNIKDIKPYTGLTVAILNSWGELRSWQTHMVAHALWYKQIYSYIGILEALSGACVEVKFISFDDILSEGISDKIDVIINAGDADTAFSGGEVWRDERLVSIIRKWVYAGGGFVGVGDPSALDHQGRYFQLADILGVDKERGFSLSSDKYFEEKVSEHFILEDKFELNSGEGMKNIYALDEQTEILSYADGEVSLATHGYGKGRGVYIAGLPYSAENTRLLIRSLFFAAHKEKLFKQWSASNLHCEVHFYPAIKKFAVVNNTNVNQTTIVYLADGNMIDLTLAPSEIIWQEMNEDE